MPGVGRHRANGLLPGGSASSSGGMPLRARRHTQLWSARANYYAGFDYFERANDEVLCVVMVETRGAVADVEEIVSVPGVDAVYIGPADLSVTLGLPPGPDNS